MMNWRMGLTAMLVALTVVGGVDGQDKRGRAPNVLFIAVDDLRPALGCYGEAAAQTPNLDQLAKQGVLFRRHYVQVPTCGASRYAMLTGRSPASSGVTRGNNSLYGGPAALSADAAGGARSMPELFRRNGYKTACIGKISHTPDGRVFAYNGKGDGRPELPGAWDVLGTPFGAWKRGWGVFFAYTGGRHREDRGGHRDVFEFEAESDGDLPDGLMAEAAIARLRAWKDEPFFLGLGFFKPHLPFVGPRKDWEAMAKSDPGTAARAERTPSPWWHRSGEAFGYKFPFEKKRPLPSASARDLRRAYFACVRYVDRQIGRVLKALDELGIADNTVVVVWGDHGWHLGELGIWGKHSPFEEAVRSALIIKGPSCRSGRSDALVESIDLYPTLVDICRLENRSTRMPLDGKSLSGLLSGGVDTVRAAALSYWGRAASVRSSSHRLIADRKGERALELYDLRKDLATANDVAAENPEVVKELRRHLPAAWRR